MPGPFNKSESVMRYTTAPTQGYTVYSKFQTWYTSSKTNGKLDLVPHPFTLDEKRVLAYNRQFHPNWSPVMLAPTTRAWASSHFDHEKKLATNAAYADLINKINNDSTAALGISLATWKQSHSMISSRMRGVMRIAKNLHKPPKPRPPFRTIRTKKGRVIRVPNRPRLNRRGVEHGSSADLFLEGIFGWLPLVTDAYAAAQQLAEDVPIGWIRGRGSCEGSRNYTTDTHRLTALSTWRCTQSLRIEGVNPNAYLLNQLGLINPATIAWDLVPWSFVVGWFGNFQAIISSLTDLYGISTRHPSVTWTERYIDTEWKANTYPKSHPGYAFSDKTLQTRYKSRSVGGLATPSFVLRMPKASMTRSLISIALATQQVRRLSTTL